MFKDSPAPPKVDGSALAGGMIAAALLDTLRTKGVLTLDECRGILAKALSGLNTQSILDEERAAAAVISHMLSGPYSAPAQDK